MHGHDVMAQPAQASDTAGKPADANVGGHLDGLRLDDKISQWMRLAQQDLALSHVLVGQSRRPAIWVVDLTRNQLRLARQATAAATTVGQIEAVPEGGIKDGFIRSGLEMIVTGPQVDPETHFGGRRRAG
jgi:hypothetical protein